MLTRDEFLKPAPRKIKPVMMTDGRQVYIRSLSEFEHSEYESSVWKTTKGGNLEMDPDLLQGQRRLLIAQCVCDDAGRPLLTTDEAEKIGDLDGGAMRALVQACREHCGLVDAPETAEKNS